MKYLSPEMQIEVVEDDDIITLSNGGEAGGETQGADDDNIGNTSVGGDW